MRNDQLEQQKQELQRQSHLFKRLFETEDGKRALATLRAEFDHVDVFDPNNERTTTFKLGQKDVITFIDQLLTLSTSEG